MGAMKGRVEAGHLQRIRKRSFGGRDTREVMGLMQRGEWNQRRQPLHHLVARECRRDEIEAAVYYAMADSSNVGLRKPVSDDGEDRAQRVTMIGDELWSREVVRDDFLATPTFHHKMRVRPDALDLPDSDAVQR